ncbi:MAG: hypothetical protein CSA81_14795, partial [Acidobacteria bacterium]
EWAESTAAPVFGEMAKFILEYKDVQPTEEYTQEDLATFTKTHNYLSSELDRQKEEAEKKEAEKKEAEEKEKASSSNRDDKKKKD